MKNYDPKKIVLTFAGILVTGYAEGTFVNAERNEDTFELSVGSDGQGTRVRNNNQSGTVTLTLQQSSPTNDLLSTRATLDELTGLGFGTLLLSDLNGTTLCRAEASWIRKPANAEYGDAEAGREWIIECEKLEMRVGGSLV